ncbi:MAG: O-antigen ligase [Acidobacteriota bacterium]|mgnify:CR=1 FL=1
MTTQAARQLATLPTLAEKAFTVFALFLSTGAFLTTLQSPHDPSLGARTGDLLTNAIWSLIYLITFLLLKARCTLSTRVFTGASLLLALVGIALASIFWSDAPVLTVLRGTALIGTTIVGVYLASRYSLRQQLRILGLTFAIAAVLSLLFALGLPSYGIASGEFHGEWVGIYAHKNNLGANMAIAFALFLALGRTEPRYRWVFRLGAGLSLLLILFSDSITSLVACVATLGLLFFSRVVTYPHRRGSRLLLGLVAVAVLFLVVFYFEEVTYALGRDLALTGRTELWDLVVGAILDRPRLGYGYGAFWRGYEGSSGDVWNAFGSELFYSHNGFLDVWLDLGLFGLGAFVVGYVVYAGRALSILRNTRDPEALWPLLLLAFIFVSNLTEGSILRSNTAAWILYTATVLSICAAKRELAGRSRVGWSGRQAPLERLVPGEGRRPVGR